MAPTHRKKSVQKVNVKQEFTSATLRIAEAEAKNAKGGHLDKQKRAHLEFEEDSDDEYWLDELYEDVLTDDENEEEDDAIPKNVKTEDKKKYNIGMETKTKDHEEENLTVNIKLEHNNFAMHNVKDEYPGARKRTRLEIKENSDEEYGFNELFEVDLTDDEDEEEGDTTHRDIKTEDEDNSIFMETKTESHEEEKLAISIKLEYNDSAQNIEAVSMYSRNEKNPDPNDPNHYCRVCHIEYTTKNHYDGHLRVQHDYQLIDPEADAELLPDIDDPDNRCRTCDKKFTFKDSYRIHMIVRHNTNMIRFPDTLPNWYDSNFYCESCDITFSTIRGFHGHCHHIHEVTALAARNQFPDLFDYGYQCRVCNFQGDDQQEYWKHCRTRHGVVIPKITSKKILQKQRRREEIKIESKGEPASEKKRPGANSKTVAKVVSKCLNHDRFNTLSCRSCKRLKVVDSGYRKHMLEHHHPKVIDQSGIIAYFPTYRCRECDLSFPDRSQYEIHWKAHHIKRRSFCYICQQSFKSERTFINHCEHKHSTPPPTPSTYCYHCKKVYVGFSSYRTHFHKFHRDKAFKIRIPNLLNSEFYCCICDDYSDDRRSFFLHCQTLHRLSPLKYCSICDMKFVSKQLFSRHIRNQHTRFRIPDIHEPTFYCEICQTRSINHRAYRIHCHMNHNMPLAREYAPDLEDPNNYCYICDKSFSSDYSFQIHVFGIHLKDTSADNVIPIISDPDLYCNACQVKFKDSKIYRLHFVAQHKMKTVKLNFAKRDSSRSKRRKRIANFKEPKVMDPDAIAHLKKNEPSLAQERASVVGKAGSRKSPRLSIPLVAISTKHE